MIAFFKLLKHKLLILAWSFSKKTEALDFYGEAVRSISGRWHGQIAPMTTYHALFDVLRQRDFSGSLFELGGGYSTILAKELFDNRQVKITSVDFYPAKYHRILNSKKNATNFLKTVDSVNEITVSFEEVEKALVIIVNRLLEYAEDDVRMSLSKFINNTQACDDFYAYIGKKDSEAICRIVTGHDGFKSEIDFYKHFDAISGEGACARIAASEVKINAVFFDCGEASSLAEFLALENSLTTGAYVLLHDIYFPKSIKNFLLAALLTLDSTWNVLYQDSVSEQGGMVAIKL
jgi:hypothetical protein